MQQGKKGMTSYTQYKLLTLRKFLYILKKKLKDCIKGFHIIKWHQDCEVFLFGLLCNSGGYFCNAEDEVEQPSSPSVKKTEEKGVTVVHEVKCKLYVKVT